ncbi:hypothetical protein DA100_08150 [Vibrio sp. Hep-1b-8]|nr:hypothetical protein DA100_08150 [Vibrio sp. Hep-1b-8]
MTQDCATKPFASSEPLRRFRLDSLNALFRGRMHTLVETCKKHGLSSLSVLTESVQALTARQPYPNVLGL